MKIISLSYFLDENTPLYGNNGVVDIKQISKIALGKTSNNSQISTLLHAGTHIDFPYHFYDDGQTLKDFSPDFWFFTNPYFLEIKPKSFIIKDEVIEKLLNTDRKNCDALIIKTGSGDFRDSDKYIYENYGLDPSIADIIRDKLPNVRVIVLDTISISSYTNRQIGREAHRKFLNPKKPILIIEDANLSELNTQNINKLIVAPLNIANTDGAPCSIYAELE